MGAMFSVEYKSAVKVEKSMLLDLKRQGAAACDPLVMLMITLIAVVVVVVVNHSLFWHPPKDTSDFTTQHAEKMDVQVRPSVAYCCWIVTRDVL
jgi:hypothetical protein